MRGVMTNKVSIVRNVVLLLLLNNGFGVVGDNLALLTGTLRTYQKTGCDGEYMILRCPVGTTISVQLAQYGKTAPLPTLCQNPGSLHPELMDLIKDPSSNATCQMPGAIQTVVGLCQKKTSCKFKTSPGTFGGDPCPGTRKYVEVFYKCRPSEFKSVIGCEREVVQLKCNRSSRLAIYSANYGRTEYESVTCPQPKGVLEESCLSSFATETVMQICHGKRRCALGVDPATFGQPCKPESSMYLKATFACVPRKVLNEKYQGDLEPDEIVYDETEDETGDPVGGVLEQPSIYSPDHSKGWTVKSTSKPSTDSKGDSSETLKYDFVEEGNVPSSKNSSQDVYIIYLISQGIQAYEFISRNKDKLWPYIIISIASCLTVIFLVLLVKVGVERRFRLPRRSSSSKPFTSASEGPITTTTNKILSDIDEISVVMGDGDGDVTTELPSILRNTNTTNSGPVEELTSHGIATVSNNTTTLPTGQRTLTRAMSNQNSAMNNSTTSFPSTMTLGRNLRREQQSNIRFYYD